jgi:predicted dehydrogenase
MKRQGHSGLARRPDRTRRAGITRRRFLSSAAASAAAAAAAPYFVPASSLGADGRSAPSERIGVAIVGVGSRGNDHFQTMLRNGQAQILATCDANKPKADEAAKNADAYYAGQAGRGEGHGCASYSDFREVIARPDVDAIFIAAPENWHALIASHAVRAGKDVYCEKALSLTVREGRQLCQAVRRYGRVLQVGTQQRSDRQFRQACELALNGYIGRLQRVEVGVPGGRELPNTPTTPVPPGLDYEMWLGPAPFTPHNDIKCSFNWYFIYDYCAGWIQSWGVHHCDIALWGAPSLLAGPLEVSGSAEFPKDGLADTSITWNVEFKAANGLTMGFLDDGHIQHGVRFIGEKGWVHVTREGIWTEPGSLAKVEIKPTEQRLYESSNHHVNFLECIRTRRDPVSPVEAGHAATTLSLIADIATRTRRKLTWDWKTETFPDDDAANRYLSRAMRAPWAM